jgi:hypothetical protein
MRIPLIAIVISVVVTLTNTAPAAHAGVTFNIFQFGSNTIVAGNGTMELSDVTFFNPSIGSGLMNPSAGILVMGPPSASISYDAFTPLSGPSTFGPGTNQPFASTGTGDIFGVDQQLNELFVPQGYVSGSPLSSTNTYSGQTFSSLGLTPGTYTWTWGTGSHADSLTVRIGSAIPEPTSLVLGTLGAVAVVIAYGWSRHSRDQRLRPAA